MLQKNKSILKHNSPKIYLPLLSISPQLKTLNNSINTKNILNPNPKTYDRVKKLTHKYNSHKSIFPTKEIVKNLDIDINPCLIMSREAEMKKLKENIDSNPDIELKRLGKYKAKQTSDENDIESKEKVKILEKKYNDDLNEYNNIKKEKEKLNQHIINLMNIIDDYKLELYSFDNYSTEIYNEFLEKKEQKKLEIKSQMQKLSYDKIDDYILLDEELQKINTKDKYSFQEGLKLKKKDVTENLIKAQELLKQLQENKIQINESSKELKNKIKENKINLIKF